MFYIPAYGSLHHYTICKTVKRLEFYTVIKGRDQYYVFLPHHKRGPGQVIKNTNKQTYKQTYEKHHQAATLPIMSIR